MKIISFLLRLSSGASTGKTPGKPADSSGSSVSNFLSVLKEKLGSSGSGPSLNVSSHSLEDPGQGELPAELPTELTKALQSLRDRDSSPDSATLNALAQILKHVSGRGMEAEKGQGSFTLDSFKELFRNAFNKLSPDSLKSLNDSLDALLRKGSPGDVERFLKALEQSGGTIQQSIDPFLDEMPELSAGERKRTLDQLKRFFEQLRRVMDRSRQQLRETLGMESGAQTTSSTPTGHPPESGSEPSSTADSGTGSSGQRPEKTLGKVIEILREISASEKNDSGAAGSSESRTDPQDIRSSLRTVQELLQRAFLEKGSGGTDDGTDLSRTTLRQLRTLIQKQNQVLKQSADSQDDQTPRSGLSISERATATSEHNEPLSGTDPAAGEDSRKESGSERTHHADRRTDQSTGRPSIRDDILRARSHNAQRSSEPQPAGASREQHTDRPAKPMSPDSRPSATEPAGRPSLRIHLETVLDRGRTPSPTHDSSTRALIQSLLRLTGDPGASTRRESAPVDVFLRGGRGQSESSGSSADKGKVSRQVGIMSSYEKNRSTGEQSMDFSRQGFSQGQHSGGRSPRTAAAPNPTQDPSTLFRTAREARQFIEQVVKKAETVIKGQKQSMTLQLEPPQLGRLHMKVQVEAGQVTAHFEVEHSGVKQTLLGRVDHLKQTLQQMGLQVDQIDISDMSPRGNEGNGKSFQSYREGSGNASGDPAANGGETEPVANNPTNGRRLREYSTFERVA